MAMILWTILGRLVDLCQLNSDPYEATMAVNEYQIEYDSFNYW